MRAIVAIDENWAIGYKGQMLFDLPGDLAYFAKKTRGHTIIMGRQTFESLPNGALKNRRNIILSRQNYKAQNAEVFNSIPSLLSSLTQEEAQNAFIIGGGHIYAEFLPLCTHLYITKINATAKNADTFFPNITQLPNWQLAKESSEQIENGISYRFCEYWCRQ